MHSQINNTKLVCKINKLSLNNNHKNKHSLDNKYLIKWLIESIKNNFSIITCVYLGINRKMEILSAWLVNINVIMGYIYFCEFTFCDTILINHKTF